MLDPDEGVGPDGEIVTGVARERVPAAFEPVVAAAAQAAAGAELYLYGSVATGRAQVGRSDVDLIGVGVPADLGAELSRRFHRVCRAVEIGPAQPDDLLGEGDEAYGNRVFRRHYCVQLAGPPRSDLGVTFPADTRAARGFNGDIATAARRWRHRLDEGAEPAQLAPRMARKSLLAAASLVSVLDATWTTDRARAARRWSQLAPDTADDMATLLAWTDPDVARTASRRRVDDVLDGTVAGLVVAFAETVGLWPTPS